MPASAASIARIGFVSLAIGLACAAASTRAAAPATGSATPPVAVAPVPAAAPATASADTITKGRALFNDWSCSSCHSLADAGASGHVGPAFDGNANLTEAFVTDRVTNGQGAMPAFGGQLSDAEIATLASYITHAAKK